MIDPPAAGQLAHAVAPGGERSIVDSLLDAELAEAFEFGVAAGCRNHATTQSLRKLQGKERNAARPLDQHGFARFEVPFGDEGVPGGYAGARERRRLFIREMRGDGDDPLGIEDNIFGSQSRKRRAQSAFGEGFGRLAVDPFLHETTGDTVASLHP